MVMLFERSTLKTKPMIYIADIMQCSYVATLTWLEICLNICSMCCLTILIPIVSRAALQTPFFKFSHPLSENPGSALMLLKPQKLHMRYLMQVSIVQISNILYYYVPVPNMIIVHWCTYSIRGTSENFVAVLTDMLSWQQSSSYRCINAM